MVFASDRRIAAIIMATVACAASGQQLQPAPSSLDRVLRTELAISSYSIVHLDLPVESGIGFFAPIELSDQHLTLDFQPNSVRSARFEALVPDGVGGYRSVEAPPPMTYRGNVLERPGAWASGAVVDGGLRAIVRLDAETTWVVMPIAELTPIASRGAHVVFDAEDGEPEARICGNDLVLGGGFRPNAPRAPHDHAAGGGDPEIDGEDIYIAEIAFDADFEFFDRNGSSIEDTIADIESVVNDINIIYERDVFLRHEITTIIVRDSEPDPYSGNDSGVLLDQMTVHWNTSQRGVERDIAHLMTGKPINGGIIGLAFLNAICSPDVGYGLSESRFSNRFDWRVGLTAHELGHNWGSPHCNDSCSGGPSCHIMCPCIASCSGLVDRFGAASISAITDFAETVRDNCLELYNPFALGVGSLRSGEVANIDVHGGLPDAEVRVYYTVRGPGTCPIKDLGVVIELANCRLALSGTTDSAGVKTWNVRMPNVNEPRPIGLQAAQQGQVSNLVRRRIQP